MHPLERSRFRLFVLAGMLAITLFLLAVASGQSVQQPAVGDSSKLSANNPIEIHRLKNDDLLKQAGRIYDKAAQEYRAAVRALVAAEVLLEAATQQADAGVEPKNAGPPPVPGGKQPTAEEKAQAAVDAAKARQAAAGQRRKLVQARKELLDRVASRAAEALSNALAFHQTLDELKSFTLEIELRVKDESIARDKVPPDLLPDVLEKKGKDLAADKVKWREKVAAGPKARAVQDKRLDQANQDVSAADADVVQKSRTLAQEHQRAELESAYAKKSTNEMLADLTLLVEDWGGLSGSHKLTLARFNDEGTKIAKLREAFVALKQPEVKVRAITRAEDVEVASRSIQNQIKYYSASAKANEELRAALTLQARHGEEFEADAAVSDEHLFKMSVFGELLGKAKVAENKFPEHGEPKYVAAADQALAKSVVEVHAATAKARAELIQLAKKVAEVKQAEAVAVKQLANLKQSQAGTFASLKWEEQFKAMSADKVAQGFAKVRQDLADKEATMLADQAQFQKAAAAVKETRAKLDGLKDPFLRQAEEEGQAERLRITRELRKDAGLDPTVANPTPAVPAETKKANGEPKNAPEKEPDKRTKLEKMTDALSGFQHLLAGRLRVLDEREDKTRDLLAALTDKEKKAAAYNTTLAEARQLALQLNAAAADLKKRVGTGQLTSANIPDGVTDALRLEFRTKLDAETEEVLTALEQARMEKKLRGTDADGLKGPTRELFGFVGQRLDLLADLKKLTADYLRERKDLSPSEIKQREQRAADRMAADGTAAEWLLAIDTSKKAKTLEELLGMYYFELIEIEIKDDNLKAQKAAVLRLVELAGKESLALARILPVLDAHATRLQADQEKKFVVVRARLKPDQADELLKAFEAKTGQVLDKPVPVRDIEKAAKVIDFADAIFEGLVQKEATRRWREVLDSRLATTGIKVETGIYQDVLAGVNAAAGTNARRVAVLTGIEPPDPGIAVVAAVAKQPVVGGEITRTRQELTTVRTEGVRAIAIKVGLIFLAALLLPRFILWPFRRAVAGEGSGLVLSALRAFLKIGAWVTAFAATLSVLGFDVTAIVAGLGIGGLAIGLAAQPMLADMIAALVIFAEGKFQIGDVIKLGDSDPAKVVGLSWRSTQLRDTVGLMIHIPNRQVTEKPVQNLTKEGKIFDILEVTVTTEGEVRNVLAVVRQALEECKYLTGVHGVSVNEFNQKGDTKIVKYRFWWFVEEYEGRDKTRDEVFTRISRSLDAEDLKGAEVTLA